MNKVATSVQLRFDVGHSPSLPEEVKTRLVRLGGSRMTSDGVLIIEARRYRTQEQDRSDAIQRLTTLLHKASLALVIRPVSPVPHELHKPTGSTPSASTANSSRDAGRVNQT
jgi:ribosome-associated protein